MRDLRLAVCLATGLLVVAAVKRQAFSQAPAPGPGSNAQRSLAEPFKGVTTDGNVVSGLYKLRSTGVSTAPVVKAAEAYLASLDEKQRQATLFPVDDIEWRKWNNVHRYERQGVAFLQMSEAQREAAFGLLRASLSAKGLKKSQDIMKLNETIGEMTQRVGEYGQWLYNITIMGKPSTKDPWGWQLDGHHLIINYFVLGDQVVMSPAFMGSEPVRADAGKFAGTIVLQDEQNKGFALMESLTPEQRKKAVIETSKTANNSVAQAFQDNLVLNYAGLRADELPGKQKQLLLDVIQEYVGNMAPGHARIRMEEIRKHLDATYFAWIGDMGPEAVFYYRIQSPVVLIEFDHQRPVALPGPRVPGRLHIHSVLRTPNGNDYGKDLLRQHYEKSHGLKKTD